MITVKQALACADTDEICRNLIFCYKTSHISDFYKLIHRLKELEPEVNESEFRIYIKVLKEVGDDYEFAGSFDEKDTTLYYDVCGADSDHDCYSIAGSRHAVFLGYYIEDTTWADFTPAMLLAHCLWEITFFGFDDRAL